MVFTSIPAYIVDPANWQQQQLNNQAGNTGTSSHHLQSPPPPLQPHGGGAAGSFRPSSMADRARMANVPMPEAAQKCPRCESTNTKFCYYNNYSLSQPRHFCKTCRRYWTHGGALRKVPVGGGCRRNKRSTKGGSGCSKSSPASSDRQMDNSVSSNSGSGNDIITLGGPQIPSLRFMPQLHQQLGDFGTEENMDLNFGSNNNCSTIFGQMGGAGDLNFQIGSALSGGSDGGGLEQWRVPQTLQYPFLAGGSYPFEGCTEAATEYCGASIGSQVVRPPHPPKVLASGVMSQLALVKMEESNQEVNLSRQLLLGINNNNPTSEQYWSGGGTTTTTAGWADFAGFSSSSTTTSNPQQKSAFMFR